MEGRSRDHIVRQTIPNGGSGDWEGPAADGFLLMTHSMALLISKWQRVQRMQAADCVRDW